MNILWRQLAFLGKYKLRVTLAYLCLFGTAGFSMATPWLVKQAIDLGLAQNDGAVLLWSGLLIVAAAAARGAFAFGQTYLGEYLGQAVAYDLRNTLYDRLQRLSYAYHDQQQTGQLMSRATADVEAMRMFIFMGTLRGVFILVLFFASCYLLWNLNWELTLIVFALLPLIGYRAVSTSLRLRPRWRAIQDSIAESGTVLQENFSGIRVVKAFAREPFEIAKFSRKAVELRELNLSANRIQALNSSFMSFLQVLIIAVILWYGGTQVIQGNLTLGGLAAFLGYLAMLAMPVRALGWMANIIARAISSGERVFEILDAESAVREKPGAPPLPEPLQGHVVFDHVSFGYDAVSAVLRDINIDAQPGQVVALLGATGSGKSTVVSLLPRFYDVTSGAIRIDGADIRDVQLASLRRAVGIVHQDVFLFTATIRDNIAYGVEHATQDAIETAAKTARLQDFIMGLPQGYDTWVGERGITLSGGQKQRLAIARTLLMDPAILILDDSTSSVDMETEYLIQQALADLMKGRTTFVIAQRLRAVLYADQILVLERGEIVEQGTHTELIALDGRYHEIYNLQLRDQAAAAPEAMAAG